MSIKVGRSSRWGPKFRGTSTASSTASPEASSETSSPASSEVSSRSGSFAAGSPGGCGRSPEPVDVTLALLALKERPLASALPAMHHFSSTPISEDFPHAIGPFAMSITNLTVMFNDFYSRNKLARPNPDSLEFSMIGMTLGDEVMEDVMLQLSPLHRITLGDEARDIAGISDDTSHFAWAYPIARQTAMGLGFKETDGAFLNDNAFLNDSAFLSFGGFVYFNEQADVTGAQTLCQPQPGFSQALTFGQPQALPHAVKSALRAQDRFWEVTNFEYAKAGATHFAWIRPGEFDTAVACTDGGFAYVFAGHSPIYFPLLQKLGAADPGFNPLQYRAEFESLLAIPEVPIVEPASSGRRPHVAVVKEASKHGRWWQCLSGRGRACCRQVP